MINLNYTMQNKSGVNFEVNIAFNPAIGVSTALLDGKIIEQVFTSILDEPNTDNDKDWEIYDDRLSDWKEYAILKMKPRILEVLNKK